VLLAGGFVAAAPTASAQDSPVLDRVVQNGELRVGMSGGQPPYNVRSRSGTLIGFEVDLATLLAAAMEVELVTVQKPFGELMAALDAGEVDMVMSGMAITPARAQRASFVGPYMLSGRSILTNSRVLAAIDEAGDIDQASLKLAALENSTSQRFIQRYVPRAQLVTVANYDEGVQMVLSDQVDAMVADMAICLLSLLRYPDQGLLTLSEPLTIEPIGIAVPATDVHFHNLVDNFVTAFEGTGLLEELRRKWLEDGSWVAALP
jgi:polar amino acid transport system substrate-binding protein